jgi:ATP-binding cassette, subfamily C, bacterial CydC
MKKTQEHSFRRLLALLRPFWGKLLLALGYSLADHSLTVASATLAPFITGLALNGATVATLTPAFIWLGVLVILRVFAAWLESWKSHEVAYEILAVLRVKVYWALERIAPGYLLKKRSGDMASAALEDVELLELFFAHSAMPAVVAFVVPVVALIILSLIHWSLALMLLPWLLLAASVPFWLSRLADKQGVTLRAAVADYGAEAVDSIQGLREVLAFRAETLRLNVLDRASHRVQAAQLMTAGRTGFENGAAIVTIGLGMVTVLVGAAWLVAQNIIGRELYPAAVVLAGASFSPVLALDQTARNWGIVKAAANRVFELLDAPAPVADLVAKDAAPTIPTPPPVVFSDVHFRYDETLPLALNGISLDIKPGETVALVGHSGAGKTTCAHLLMRFWDVEGGSISIGGVDVRQFPQENLRSYMTLVPQDIYLFNTTILENIRLAKPGATDAEIFEAARLAQIHDFIADLPEGYATQVGERGVQLSGGQRQRIAIARAIMKAAPVLILDEAVSNLDAENEIAVHKAMREVRKGRTTLIIAHRLSTIRSADRIIVLDAGRVVEQGTHADLVARNGFYNHLITGGGF